MKSSSNCRLLSRPNQLSFGQPGSAAFFSFTPELPSRLTENIDNGSVIGVSVKFPVR